MDTTPRYQIPTGTRSPFGFNLTGQPAPPMTPAATAATDPLQAALAALKQMQNQMGGGSIVPNQAPPQTVGGAPGAPVPQFDPTAGYQQQTPPPPLPGLNTGGANPYLSDPLMAGYNRMQNPLYMNQGQQQDFYGDPEIFNAPSVQG